MGIAYNTSQVTDGLVFSIDAANPRSYSGSGITVNGLVSGIGGTLVNGVGFSSANNGSFFFDGTNDQISTANIDLSYTNKVTVNCWVKVLNYREVNGSSNIVFEFLLLLVICIFLILENTLILVNNKEILSTNFFEQDE